MAAFKVPADLADLPLTLAQVRDILDKRSMVARLQNRLDALPAKEAELRKQLESAKRAEAILVGTAQKQATDAVTP